MMVERREERDAGGGDGDTDHTDPSFTDHSRSISKKYIQASHHIYVHALSTHLHSRTYFQYEQNGSSPISLDTVNLAF